MSEFDPDSTPSAASAVARPTPLDELGRTELAAMVAGLNLDSISRADSRLLSGALTAARSALSAPFASLQFLGVEQVWYLGDSDQEDRVCNFIKGVTRTVLHADGVVQVFDLESHSTFAQARAVRGEPGLRWLVSVPIRGYNNLVIGAMTLLDTQPRLPLSESEGSTLESLVAVIEAALESHRTRVAARAQRNLLVRRLRDAHTAAAPVGSDQRRTIHDLKNALTVIRLSSQTMEESGRFDPDAFADIRGSLRMAEDAARQLRMRIQTPVPTRRSSWATICENQRLRIETHVQYSNRTASIVDESPNLKEVPTPDCLEDVANMLVDRALEMSPEGAELKLSLRVFPHFARFSVCISAREDLESPVGPVLAHPARNALVAIGGSITSSSADDTHRLSAWFPLDAEATYVI